jgi:predicted GIY-YIG superfamily endonuclease
VSDFVLYRFWKGNDLLYIGMSIRAYQRFTEHQATAVFFAEATNITMERFADFEDLQIAESQAIRNEGPKYNVAQPEVKAEDAQHCCSMHRQLLSARAKQQHERLRNDGLIWGVDVGLTSTLPESVVVIIANLHNQGLSLRKIAAHLNKEQIFAAQGGQWQANQVARVLSSPRTKRIAEMKL